MDTTAIDMIGVAARVVVFLALVTIPHYFLKRHGPKLTGWPWGVIGGAVLLLAFAHLGEAVSIIFPDYPLPNLFSGVVAAVWAYAVWRIHTWPPKPPSPPPRPPQSPLTKEQIATIAKTIDSLEVAHCVLMSIADRVPGLSIFVVDPGLRIVVAGGEPLRRSGFDPGQLMGECLEKVITSAEVIQAYQEALKGGHREIRIVHDDLCYSVTFWPVYSGSEIIAAVAISREVYP